MSMTQLLGAGEVRARLGIIVRIGPLIRTLTSL
jgi:hypothetical protein